jgi:hypothetical protein
MTQPTRAKIVACFSTSSFGGIIAGVLLRDGAISTPLVYASFVLHPDIVAESSVTFALVSGDDSSFSGTLSEPMHTQRITSIPPGQDHVACVGMKARRWPVQACDSTTCLHKVQCGDCSRGGTIRGCYA